MSTCAALVNMIAEFRKDPELELEVSATLKTEFGVDKTIYKRLKQAAIADAEKGCVTITQRKTRALDCFYSNHIRQRCTEIKVAKPETIAKTRVAHVQANCALLSDYVFHFHLKREKPVTEALEPQVPLFIRATRTLSCDYNDAYRYTFKKVRQGNTKEEVCKAPTHYEIEIELLHDKTYLDAKNDLEIAQSMIHKALALFPHHDKNMVPVKLSMVFEGEVVVPEPKSLKQSKITSAKQEPKAKRAKKKQPNEDE